MKRVHTEASWHSFYAASTPFRHSRSLFPSPSPLNLLKFRTAGCVALRRFRRTDGRISASTQSREESPTDTLFETAASPLARPSAPSRVLVQRAPSLGDERNDLRSARASQRGEIRYGISPFPLHKLSNYCKQWYRTRHESQNKEVGLCFTMLFNNLRRTDTHQFMDLSSSFMSLPLAGYVSLPDMGSFCK